MTIVKLAQMSENEINSAIDSQNLCRIAFIDDEYPYISPFQYVFMDNNLYFHFTNYGKKKKILTKNPNVCVSIENFKHDLSSYYFISIQGKLEIVEDIDLRVKIMKQMAELARKKYSKNFLQAHGFDKEEDWDILASENQLIYKLNVSNKPIGLKS
jgi:nitroimidazol reductase NimA-like FMN-containing flavoprotein (pyridoxamine 5'-phosphate oxidase superfamily)